MGVGSIVESCFAEAPATAGAVGAQGPKGKEQPVGRWGGAGERRGSSAGSGNSAGSQPLGPLGELGCCSGHVRQGVLRVAAACWWWGRPSVGRALSRSTIPQRQGAPCFHALSSGTIDAPGGAGLSTPGQGRQRRMRSVLPRIASPPAQRSRERWG